MWSLFPELLGPMMLAFIVGSIFAWAVIGLLLPRRPAEVFDERPTGSRGP